MFTPTKGMIVRHIRTEGLYQVQEVNALAKINEKWEPVVIYKSLENDHRPTFVREHFAFCDNFTPASDATSDAKEWE
jgi:hypothetical protein